MIKTLLQEDEFFNQVIKGLQQEHKEKKYEGYHLEVYNLLLYNNRLYVPNSTDLRHMVMDKFHRIPYVGHLSYLKMVTSIRKLYYWLGMKQDIAEYIAKFLEFQQVKVEHGHPIVLLQRFPIIEWNLEMISMDFITGLPKTVKKHDATMVAVDKLSKVVHFIPLKSTFKTIDVANVFIKENFRLHGFPKTIILDRDSKFTSSFWKIFFAGLGTQLEFSMAYHPQTDG
jgi:hypothetical protein